MIRRLVVSVLVVATVLSIAPVSSGHHYVAIQPGSERPGHTPPKPGDAPCTYNFIFRDQQNRRYIGIAGHCTGPTSDVGQVMYVTDVGRIGTVVWKAPIAPGGRTCPALVPQDGPDSCIDFVLVRIDRALYGHIDPSMRHWGGPTGYLSTEEIEAGMRMYHYGYGRPMHANEITRPRAGVVLGMAAGGCGYRVAYPLGPNDSGAPQIAEDGRALGFVSGHEAGDGALGMTLDCVLGAAANAGYRLELETAPLKDAVQREKDRVPHAGGPNL